MGQGSVTYDFPVGSGGGGGGSVTGAFNGLSMNGTDAVLGQDTGQIGNPGELVTDRQIPLNGFQFQLAYDANSFLSFSPAVPCAISWFQGTGGQQFLEIITNQGANPAPGQPFGNFFVTLDQSFVNPDGQDDCVLQWGYNQTGVGGPRNLNEAAIWWSMESHFGVPGGVQFEIELQSVSKTGNVNRHIAIDVNKTDGTAICFCDLDQFDLRSTIAFGNHPYFDSDRNGNTTITGVQAQLQLHNSTAATWGQLLINTNLDGSVGFSNGSTGANPNFSMTGALTLGNTSNAVPDLMMNSVNDGIGIEMSGGAGASRFVPWQVSGSFDGGILGLLQNGSGTGNSIELIGAAGSGDSMTLYRNIDFIAATDWNVGMKGSDGSFNINNSSSGLLTNNNRLKMLHAGNVGIGDGVADPVVPDPSAVLSLFSTQWGFLPPQMTTTQKLAIVTPAIGLTVSDITLNQLSYWNGTTWINL